MRLLPLRLKKNEERRLRAGHLWVYSNEVDIGATPLAEMEPGQPVEIQASNGGVLGTGYANPRTLICARLVSRDPAHPLSGSLLVHRLKVALSLRERLYPEPYYRLVHGEGDGLPGLVVDRYGDVLVVQISTAGMERLRAEVVTALEKVLRPTAILLRNDASIRALEGLEAYVEPVLGPVPDLVALSEHGTRFEVPLLEGQKTGWFFDQRQNRGRMRHYVAGRRVLDLFSYLGAWGLQAAAAGADAVVCVDSSRPALERLQANAELNGLQARVQSQCADVFEALRVLRNEREHFDVVILDPPAFIKRKKDLQEGLTAYRRLNQMAMQVLARDGIVISNSCSYHLPRESLQQVLLAAARHLDRNLQVLEQGHQGPDHPVHPAIAETDYLKAIFGRVLPA